MPSAKCLNNEHEDTQLNDTKHSETERNGTMLKETYPNYTNHNVIKTS
jgi:hypothetical protein